ncbi:hypothetical protein BSKO_13140 [Bryopsis sp. KO-2023]|nr:hypothetical protein BSKO_13140 [Bryopsis sp. KO-2023]
MSSTNWKFCPISGYLLDISAQGASCSVSGYKKDLEEIEDIKIVGVTDMEDYRRRFKLEPLVKQSTLVDDSKGIERATVDEPCPNCGYHQLEFYTLQLRSADEGQTVFYECTKCGHKYSQNN